MASPVRGLKEVTLIDCAPHRVLEDVDGLVEQVDGDHQRRQQPDHIAEGAADERQDALAMALGRDGLARSRAPAPWCPA